MYSSLFLVLICIGFTLKYYSRFFTGEKKANGSDNTLTLKYDESDEECNENVFLLGKSSFMQQISTSSNTDSDFRFAKLETD